MPSRKNIIKLVVLLAVAILVLAARFLIINPATASQWIIKYGYWAIALTFAGFITVLVKQLPTLVGVWQQCKAHRAGLLCVLLAGVYFQVHEPREFMVLFDEFVISGVARNMHFDREALLLWSPEWTNGRSFFRLSFRWSMTLPDTGRKTYFMSMPAWRSFYCCLYTRLAAPLGDRVLDAWAC
jgi:hypothetical protein